MSSSSAYTSNACKQELSAFGNALTALANSNKSTLAKFSEMFKELKVKDSEVKLDPEEKKLADAIFGAKKSPRPLPCIPFGIPALPLLIIFSHLSPYDILNFARISEASEALVKSLRLKVKSLTLFRCTHFCNITIEAKNGERTKLSFAFNPYHEIQKANGVGFTKDFWQPAEDQKWYCKNRDEQYEMSNALLKKALELFKPQQYTLIEDRIEEAMMFIKNVSNRFDLLRFFGHNVDLQQFRILMKECEADEFHTYEFPTGYTGTFRYRKCKVENGQAIRIDNIINMECQELKVSRSTLTVFELNMLFRKWAEGGLPQLKRCFFEFDMLREILHRHWPKLTGGVETVPWDPSLGQFENSRSFLKLCIKNVSGERAVLFLSERILELRVV